MDYNFDPKKKITAKLINGDMVSLQDQDFEGFGKLSKIKNLLIDNLQVVNKDKQKQQSDCYVCEIPFDELKKNSEFCRVCGNSVCGPCMRKTINDLKVCDLCCMKNIMINTISRHYELLTSKKKINEDSKMNKIYLDDEINKIDKEIRELKLQQLDPHELQRQKEEKEEQKAETEERLREKIKTYQNKQNLLDQENDQLWEVQSQINQVQTQINGIQMEIKGLKEQVENDSKKAKEMTNIKKKLENSKTFMVYNEGFSSKGNSAIKENQQQQNSNNNSDKKTVPNRQISNKLNQNPKNDKYDKISFLSGDTSVQGDIHKNNEIAQEEPCVCKTF